MESQFGQCWKQKCLIKVKIELASIISSSKKKKKKSYFVLTYMIMARNFGRL